MRILALFLAFTLPIPTHADQTIDKTPRMAAIEVHFDMRMIGVLHSGKEYYWIFMHQDADAMFKGFPVVVAPGATNHDVDTAIIAAKSCASFYDFQVKDSVKPAPSASPSPGASTAPAKPTAEQRL